MLYPNHRFFDCYLRKTAKNVRKKFGRRGRTQRKKKMKGGVGDDASGNASDQQAKDIRIDLKDPNIFSNLANKRKVEGTSQSVLSRLPNQINPYGRSSIQHSPHPMIGGQNLTNRQKTQVNNLIDTKLSEYSKTNKITEINKMNNTISTLQENLDPIIKILTKTDGEGEYAEKKIENFQSNIKELIEITKNNNSKNIQNEIEELRRNIQTYTQNASTQNTKIVNLQEKIQSIGNLKKKIESYIEAITKTSDFEERLNKNNNDKNNIIIRLKGNGAIDSIDSMQGDNEELYTNVIGDLIEQMESATNQDQINSLKSIFNKVIKQALILNEGKFEPMKDEFNVKKEAVEAKIAKKGEDGAPEGAVGAAD